MLGSREKGQSTVVGVGDFCETFLENLKDLETFISQWVKVSELCVGETVVHFYVTKVGGFSPTYFQVQLSCLKVLLFTVKGSIAKLNLDPKTPTSDVFLSKISNELRFCRFEFKVPCLSLYATQFKCSVFSHFGPIY